MHIRRTLAAACLVFAAAAAAGQSRIPEAVREAVGEGASLYRAGRFAEAQEHCERALKAAPRSATIALFVARAVQQQYQPGLDTPANRAKGAEAIAAYERVLSLAAGDDLMKEDAYKAVIFLHGKLGADAQVRAWLLRRAHDETAGAEKRAEAFVILASKRWQCSYDITEREEHKRVTRRELPGGGLRVTVRYSMPRARRLLAGARLHCGGARPHRAGGATRTGGTECVVV